MLPPGMTLDRATVRQRKTGHPVKFEMTDQTRQAVDEYLKISGKKAGEPLFCGRSKDRYLTTRQYARLFANGSAAIEFDSSLYGTHSLRRTKATLIY